MKIEQLPPTTRPIPAPKPNKSTPPAPRLPAAEQIDGTIEIADARAVPPVATQPKQSTITIHARLDGFTFDVSFSGKLSDLPAYLERLRAVGATPSSAMEYSYTPEGLPICPRHGVPMKKRERQGDTWFSHAITGPGGEDAYCCGYPGKKSPGWDF